MEEKIRILQEEIGLSLRQIEQKSNLGNGTLSQVLKTSKFKKTTERKLNEFYFKTIKKMVNGL